MPVINGKFYMNPAFGRAIEAARAAESASNPRNRRQDPNIHWVTIDHRHIPISESQGQSGKPGRGNRVFSGDATYYNLPGSKTASGERFDPNKMSAAMTAEKARLGQTVTVTYAHKDQRGNTVTRSISVVVNDRGPFARNANGAPIHPLQPDAQGVIDLTPAAFRQLTGSLSAGRVHVTVAVPK